MHIGIILLSWLCIAIVTVVALVASGMLSIHIEIVKDEKKKKDKKSRGKEK